MPRARERPRKREVAPSPKIPLTYYRSSNSPPSRSPFEGSKPKARSVSKTLLRLVDLAIIAILIIVLGYSLVVSATPRVVVSDVSYHPQSDYQGVSSDALKGISSRNKMTFDEKQLVNKLTGAFPEIRTASVVLPLIGQQPVVSIDIAPPAMILSTEAGERYLIDSSGTAIGRASDFPALNKLMVVEDKTGFDVKIGHKALSSNTVVFIKTVVKNAEHANVPIKSLVLPALPLELDFYVADQPYFTKFYLGGDVAAQVGQFIAARHNFAENNITPEQYLDCRVKGKIFYK